MPRHLIGFCLIVMLAIVGGCEASEPDVFAPVFAAHGMNPQTSTLIVTRLSDGKVWESNPARAAARFIPASTSKIPHTLIALETHLAAPDTVFKWDGRERSYAVWNQDQTLTQAYQRSAVWVFQNITQSLGPDVMADWLGRLNYGNHAVGTAEDLSRYWLSGPLEISAAEQVGFLTRLIQKRLPLSAETYERAWPIFENDAAGDAVLYAKSGWMYDENAMDIGWFVGWVESANPAETYVFAMNMDMPQESDQTKRKPIVMDALKAISAWPQ